CSWSYTCAWRRIGPERLAGFAAPVMTKADDDPDRIRSLPQADAARSDRAVRGVRPAPRCPGPARRRGRGAQRHGLVPAPRRRVCRRSATRSPLRPWRTGRQRRHGRRGSALLSSRPGEPRREKAAKEIQLLMEYDPLPPYDAGSPRTAGAALVDAVSSARKQIGDERRRIVERAAAKL